MAASAVILASFALAFSVAADAGGQTPDPSLEAAAIGTGAAAALLAIGGAVLMGFGGKHRADAIREARRRVELGVTPIGVSLRF